MTNSTQDAVKAAKNVLQEWGVGRDQDVPPDIYDLCVMAMMNEAIGAGDICWLDEMLTENEYDEQIRLFEAIEKGLWWPKTASQDETKALAAIGGQIVKFARDWADHWVEKAREDL